MPKILFLWVSVTTSIFIWSQDIPEDAPISKESWEKCEKFIQSEAESYFRKGIFLITPHNSHPFPIEKDPNTGCIYIHLKGHPGCYLGKGSHKVVSKSILYNTHAKVVARCEADETGKRETEILQKFKDIQGVNQWYSTIQRSHERYDLFIEFANKGNLSQALDQKTHLYTSALLSVLFDLSSGLTGIHDRGYIHRDIKRANIFLSKKNGQYHGIIGDVCFAIPIQENLDSCFCIPDENTPPEIYIKSFKEIDRKKADTYSLGVLFYILVFEKKPSWTFFIHKRHLQYMSKQEQIKRHEKIQELYKTSLWHIPEQKDEIREKIAKITLQMVHPDPTKRPTLTQVKMSLKALMQ